MDTAQLATPTTAGTSFAGGIYAGRFFIGADAYALIVSPRAEGDLDDSVWNKSRKSVAGALSYNDGLTNTQAMAEAGSALAKRVLELRIAGHDDWYLMSRLEALIAFAELGAGEHFEETWYWTSTQYAANPGYAWSQSFDNGYQDYNHKDGEYRARAVRRLKI